jgi:protein-S-isoprenylcysteine O-methyltransferase Ste14
VVQETAIKSAFVFAFVSAAAAASSAARRAAARHHGPVNQLQHEVRGLVVARGAIGLVFYAALISWLFNVPRTEWMRLHLSFPIRWLGVALLAACVAALASSYYALGSNYRGGIGLHEGHELVTRGPYHVVRHPIYSSFILTMLSATLVSSNWLLGVSGLILVVLIAVVRLPREEMQLRDRFAARWEQYRATTGSLVPNGKSFYAARRSRGL